jgi:RimJ/RimL family protein N-acetyltransferase
MSDQPPFLQGTRCYLRALTPTDAEGDYLTWLNDVEVTRYLEAGRTPMNREALRQFLSQIGQDSAAVWLAICDQANGQHIGNITLQGIHPVHRRAHLGLMIGDKAYWGKGYAHEATALLVDYGFRRWNLHSIWLGVLADHHAAIRVYEKVGFKLDGREREAWWADGRYHDLLHMSILAREHFARLEGEAPNHE